MEKTQAQNKTKHDFSWIGKQNGVRRSGADWVTGDHNMMRYCSFCNKTGAKHQGCYENSEGVVITEGLFCNKNCFENWIVWKPIVDLWRHHALICGDTTREEKNERI